MFLNRILWMLQCTDSVGDFHGWGFAFRSFALRSFAIHSFTICSCNAICLFKLSKLFTSKADILEKTTFEKRLVWLVLSLSLTSYPSACLTLAWIGVGKEQLFGGRIG